MGASTLWHDPLKLCDGDSTPQGPQLRHPTTTLSSWPMPSSCFSGVSSPRRLVPPPAPSCSCSLVSTGCAHSSHLAVSSCTATRSWEKDFLPAAGGGQSCEQPSGLPCLQSWLALAPVTPGCLTKIAAMERGLLTFFIFLFFFFPFFFLCSSFPRPPQKGSGISSYRCGIGALVAKYIRHGSW